MKLYPLHCTWYSDENIVERECLTPKPVEAFILRFPSDAEVEDRAKRGIVTVGYYSCEPRLYKDITILDGDKKKIIKADEYPDFIKENHHKLSYVFDFDERVVGKIPNCIHTLSAYSFIPKLFSSRYRSFNKEFAVSFVCTNKTDSPLQLMRHIIWNDQDRISIPKHFYNSSRKPMKNDFGLPSIHTRDEAKNKLFRAMFSITLENSIEKDYFTEKIIDCFCTKTIPIYIGCPNIGDFFDTDGIIFAKDEEGIFNICNNLTPEEYYHRLSAVNRNYVLSQPFLTNAYERIPRTVQQNLFPDFVFDQVF